MQWKGRRESDNVDDRRGGGGRVAFGGGIGIIIIIVGLFFGKDLSGLVSQMPTGTQQTTQAPINDEQTKFIKVVYADNEDVWNNEFQKMGRTYENPTLVLFSDHVQSACGSASSAVGPFYCPGDNQVYIDLTFFDELKNRFGAAGDFAQAYVIAHEVGHHVQNLLGTSAKLQAARGRVSEVEYNRLSVMLELQADFYAGVWAHYTQIPLDAGDLDEALNAANAIGDDKLQREAQGTVVPDSFTHGTSAQRMFWFKKGYETGDIKQGDTFNARKL